jgi:hypothetical protein
LTILQTDEKTLANMEYEVNQNLKWLMDEMDKIPKA